jgi:flagellar biogenesis protein FliO
LGRKQQQHPPQQTPLQTALLLLLLLLLLLCWVSGVMRVIQPRTRPCRVLVSQAQ